MGPLLKCATEQTNVLTAKVVFNGCNYQNCAQNITYSNSPAERVAFYIFLSCLTWTVNTPRYEMSLIQKSREGDIRGNTTVREVENVLEHRGEREGHAGRDGGEKREC